MPTNKRQRRNGSPEEDTILHDIMPSFKRLGLDMTRTESRAVYNLRAKRYLKPRHLEDGFSDFVGNDLYGNACFIECKARSARCVPSEDQKLFLRRKINGNCFAVCVNSSELLCHYYQTWFELACPVLRRNYLSSLIG